MPTEVLVARMTDPGSWFSLKRFTLALGTISLGMVGGGPLLPLGGIGIFLGTLLGAFAAGLAVEHRPLLECSLAGLLTGLGFVVASKLGGDLIGAIIGLIFTSPQELLLVSVLNVGLAALGAHFGNDFRDGLTQPLEE